MSTGCPVAERALQVFQERCNTSKQYRGTREYALIFAELITAARYRGTVTYQELAELVGLPLQGNFMGAELGDAGLRVPSGPSSCSELDIRLPLTAR
jgi:hypothetical protein